MDEIGAARPVELGHVLMEMGRVEDAREAFGIALADPASAPEEVLDAAVGLLQAEGDYARAYDALLSLHRAGALRDQVLSVLGEAFYRPNEADLRARYRESRKLLKKYPYLFRKGFPAFEDLPVRFYPYDDESYVPYDTRTGLFGDRWIPRYEVVSRNFFRDLTDPVLATDVWSQYELEYLRDTVRRSEDVGRENHIYLHYTDWETFCSYLQVWDLRPLLEEEKIVFLIGDEIDQYPIDFRERFGIDYARYPLRPVRLREVKRLIWHTQLSAHNGGDFFNEIFDGHPDLICLPSVLMSDVTRLVSMTRQVLEGVHSVEEARHAFRHWEKPEIAEELFRMGRPSDKDLLTAIYLGQTQWDRARDPASRIAPALFFQPHFRTITYLLHLRDGGDACLESREADEILRSPIFDGFPYVKTFTPLRRFTTSYGATVRYGIVHSDFEAAAKEAEQYHTGIDPFFADSLSHKILNRSFLTDPRERPYRDSVIVRFEDAKLCPEATFRALAAFLDLPYTESMRGCSRAGERDPLSEDDPSAARGMDPSAVYRTYDDYAGDPERILIEWCFRDACAAYGYDPQWWDGSPLDEARVSELVERTTVLDHWILEDWESASRQARRSPDGTWDLIDPPEEMPPEERRRIIEERLDDYHYFRRIFARAVGMGLRYVSKDGTPLRMTPLLRPDPALVDGPLYH